MKWLAVLKHWVQACPNGQLDNGLALDSLPEKTECANRADAETSQIVRTQWDREEPRMEDMRK